jgi:hypothetical protein
LVTSGLVGELSGVVRLVGGDAHVDVADHQMAERWSRLPLRRVRSPERQPTPI